MSVPLGVDWNAEVARYLPLGPTADAARGQLVTGLCEGAQTMLEGLLGRTFARVAYVESYDGNGRRHLYLRRDPIRALASVSINGGAMTVDSPDDAPVYPPSQIVVPGTLDCIELTKCDGYFPPGNRNIVVSYTAGLAGADGPPRAVIQAAVLLASHLYRERDRLGISSQNLNQITTSFDHNIPKYIQAMVSPFLRTFGAVS